MFDSCVEELEKLRGEALTIQKPEIDDVIKQAVELGQRQVSCIQAMNSLFGKVSSFNQLQVDRKISMPDKNSVVNFVGLVKTGQELVKEGGHGGDKGAVIDGNVARQLNARLDHLMSCDLETKTCIRNLYELVNHFNSDDEREESLVNTIQSVDVSTSSPI
ncbi:hypothetical protein TcasGA2_TC015641 [Tribolium castaneum]|uniref:Uncharacterized protein n=1 Tax=Tribolium castaneum TaxID=7070 RepID=D2A638_TRICA|nr:hypothetical protein TcasGA2_TC015641 [Tribolium castaneum]